MKTMLQNHYGEKIVITSNIRKNESDLVYSAHIKPEDLVIKMKNQDLMREAGQHIREAIQKVDFGLQDKFCDGDDLRDSWENTAMPMALINFFSALFRIPACKLHNLSHKAADLPDNYKPDLVEDEEEDDDMSYLRSGRSRSGKNASNDVSDHCQ